MLNEKEKVNFAEFHRPQRLNSLVLDEGPLLVPGVSLSFDLI